MIESNHSTAALGLTFSCGQTGAIYPRKIIGSTKHAKPVLSGAEEITKSFKQLSPQRAAQNR
jgi:hypothetical protein